MHGRQGSTVYVEARNFLKQLRATYENICVGKFSNEIRHAPTPVFLHEDRARHVACCNGTANNFRAFCDVDAGFRFMPGAKRNISEPNVIKDFWIVAGLNFANFHVDSLEAAIINDRGDKRSEHFLIHHPALEPGLLH